MKTIRLFFVQLSQRQKTKIITLAVFLLLVQTWFWRILLLLCILLVIRKQIASSRIRYGIIAAACFLLFCTAPRMRYNTSDRVRLIYQDCNYQPLNVPLHHYLCNLILPEQHAALAGCVATKTGGYALAQNKYFHLGNSLLNYFAKYGSTWHCLRPYHKLEASGNFVCSGIYPQALNQFLGENNHAVYVISPKNYDPQKTYPVIVFLHGYLGNWQCYTGLLKDYNNYIIICPSTHNLKGLWNSNDLRDITQHQLSFLETLGYKIDRKNVHLHGLSNGTIGSAVAVRHFGNHFRSITFHVGGNPAGNNHPHIFHIYGKDDAACPYKWKEIRKTNSYIYLPSGGHFVWLDYPNEIRNYLLEQYKRIEVQ